MPDWRAIVRQRISDLRLRAVDEMDVVEELAQHIEDRYGELVNAGASDDEALGGSLAELDGETLAAELADSLVKPPKN
jgi:hypothetical protein